MGGRIFITRGRAATVIKKSSESPKLGDSYDHASETASHEQESDPDHRAGHTSSK
jgi:hypothetical protein